MIKNIDNDAFLAITIFTILITFFLLLIYLNKEYFEQLSLIQSIVVPKYYSNEFPMKENYFNDGVIPFYYEDPEKESIMNADNTIELFGGKTKRF